MKYIDGFLYREIDGFLRISNGNLDRPLPLNEIFINKACRTMKNRSLSKLSFGTPFDALKRIDFLRDFNFLTGLDIGITDYPIDPIYHCPRLEEIYINAGYLGALDFTRFSRLTKVLIDWKSNGVESLFDCPSLENVSIFNYSGSLEKFESLSKLKELVLYSPKLISLSGIGCLKELETLQITSARKLKDLGDIEDLPRIQNLFIHGAKSLIDLSPIRYLKSLKILNLDNLGKVPTIGFLETLKGLEECYFGESTNVVDGDLSVIEDLREKHSLQKVIFTNRRHYSHTKEQLGYKVPESIAFLLNRNQG